MYRVLRFTFPYMAAATGLKRYVLGFVLPVLFLVTPAACSFRGDATATATQPMPSPTLTSAPTVPPSPVPAAPLDTATPQLADSGWRPVTAGVELRQRSVRTQAGDERLTIVRIDPTAVRFRVAYEPAHPQTVRDWAADLSGALLVANAGYFTPDNQATGLLVSDGHVHGASYGDFAGMLAVLPDGRVEVRWLRATPYRSSEPLAQAVQCFPVLVKPDNVMGFPPDADEGQVARRTVVAQDFQGRILFVVSPQPRFSLHELAVYLTESDLEIDVALNLDGGFSTGLWLAGEGLGINSSAAIPAVIAVEPRE